MMMSFFLLPLAGASSPLSVSAALSLAMGAFLRWWWGWCGDAGGSVGAGGLRRGGPGRRGGRVRRPGRGEARRRLRDVCRAGLGLIGEDDDLDPPVERVGLRVALRVVERLGVGQAGRLHAIPGDVLVVTEVRHDLRGARRGEE